MRKLLSILVLFFLQIGNLSAQSGIDSLFQALEKADSDQEKISILILLGNRFTDNAPDSALMFARQAGLLNKKNKNIPTEISLQAIISSANWTIGDYSESLKAAKEHLRLARQISDTFAIAGSMNSIANTYFETGQAEKGLQYRKESLIFAGKNPFVLAQMLLNIGDDYREAGRYSEALFYTDSAARLFEKTKNGFYPAFCHLNTGEIFLDSGLYDRAIAELETARQTFFSKKEDLFLSYALADLGDAYYSKKEIKTASEYYLKALTIAKKIHSGRELVQLYKKISAISAENKDYEKAYTYFKEYKYFSDSVSAEHQQKNIRLTEARLRFTEQQKEWELISRENELSRENLRQKEYLIGGLLGGLVLISILTLGLVRQNRHKQTANLLLSEKNEEIISQQQQISEQKDSIEAVNRELEHKNEVLDKMNNDKNDLISIVAHDLKSPLNQIKGLVELMNLDDNPLSETQNQYLSLIGTSSFRLKTMIDQMLDIRAIESQEFNLKIETQNVTELLRSVCRRFVHLAEKKQIRLICELPKEPLFALADKNNFEQIIENLLSNALKFSLPNTEVRLSAERENDRLLCSVIDQGPGISEEEQSQLFTAYRKLSARPTGGETSSGLGLFGVKKYAEQMGAWVKCKSKAGEGACFSLSLPAQDAPAQS